MPNFPFYGLAAFTSAEENAPTLRSWRKFITIVSRCLWLSNALGNRSLTKLGLVVLLISIKHRYEEYVRENSDENSELNVM